MAKGKPRRPTDASAEAARARRAVYRALDDGRLIALLRADDHHAFYEFVARYSPILHDYARRAGIRYADLEDLAVEVLEDVAIRFMTTAQQMPDSMEDFLVECFKNRFLNLRRHEDLRGRAVGEAPAGLAMEDMLTEETTMDGCSQGTLRASRGPGWEPAPLPMGVAKLARMIEEGLTDEEWLILSCVSEYVPQRTIADWVGTTHGALRVQLNRLRERLDEVATEFASRLSGAEQKQIQRFFSQCDRAISDAS